MQAIKSSIPTAVMPAVGSGNSHSHLRVYSAGSQEESATLRQQLIWFKNVSQQQPWGFSVVSSQKCFSRDFTNSLFLMIY
jgi:hypothetical protein